MRLSCVTFSGGMSWGSVIFSCIFNEVAGADCVGGLWKAATSLYDTMRLPVHSNMCGCVHYALVGIVAC